MAPSLGKGWGMGIPLAARNSEPVTWPTAERSPHKSPSPVDGGAVGGLRWAHWCTRCHSLFGRPAQRRRPGEQSSGGSADGVTPSAATGAAFEPVRSLRGFAVFGLPSGPASGMAGDRGDDLTGGTGPERSDGSGPHVSSSSGFVAAQRQGNRARDPRAREWAASQCRQLRRPGQRLFDARTQCALKRRTKRGAKPPGSR